MHPNLSSQAMKSRLAVYIPYVAMYSEVYACHTFGIPAWVELNNISPFRPLPACMHTQSKPTVRWVGSNHFSKAREQSKVHTGTHRLQMLTSGCIAGG